MDVLAHATAIPQRKAPAAELAPEEWDRVMAVNAKGAFLLCRSVIPVLPKPGGVIVFTGSFTGEVGQAQRAAYSASKGALRLFTQSLALELAHDGIRVNGVAPAFVESAMGRQGLELTAANEGISVEQAQALRDAGIPLARQAIGREVATRSCTSLPRSPHTSQAYGWTSMAAWSFGRRAWAKKVEDTSPGASSAPAASGPASQTRGRILDAGGNVAARGCAARNAVTAAVSRSSHRPGLAALD